MGLSRVSVFPDLGTYGKALRGPGLFYANIFGRRGESCDCTTVPMPVSDERLAAGMRMALRGAVLHDGNLVLDERIRPEAGRYLRLLERAGLVSPGVQARPLYVSDVADFRRTAREIAASGRRVALYSYRERAVRIAAEVGLDLAPADPLAAARVVETYGDKSNFRRLVTAEVSPPVPPRERARTAPAPDPSRDSVRGRGREAVTFGTYPSVTARPDADPAGVAAGVARVVAYARRYRRAPGSGRPLLLLQDASGAGGIGTSRVIEAADGCFVLTLDGGAFTIVADEEGLVDYLSDLGRRRPTILKPFLHVRTSYSVGVFPRTGHPRVGLTPPREQLLDGETYDGFTLDLSPSREAPGPASFGQVAEILTRIGNVFLGSGYDGCWAVDVLEYLTPDGRPEFDLADPNIRPSGVDNYLGDFGVLPRWSDAFSEGLVLEEHEHVVVPSSWAFEDLFLSALRRRRVPTASSEDPSGVTPASPPIPYDASSVVMAIGFAGRDRESITAVIDSFYRAVDDGYRLSRRPGFRLYLAVRRWWRGLVSRRRSRRPR